MSTMSKKKDERAAKELARQTDPDRAARLGKKANTNDAYCTECTEWYNTSNQAEVNKHAH